MTTDRHIVELLQALKGHDSDSTLMIAEVKSISPFSIVTCDVTISDNIYMNDQTEFKSGDTVVILQNGISFYILERVVKAS